MYKVLNESSLARSQEFVEMKLVLKVTATAGAALFAWGGNMPAPRLIAEGGTGSALTTITQATVDALLASTNEILVTTAFGTTGMVDNDTFAMVLDCAGQLDFVETIEGYLATTAGATAGIIAPIQGTKTALTNATFTGVQAYVSALGNLAVRLTFTNVSAATSAGYMYLTIRAKLK